MSKQSKKWVLAVFALSLGAPAICTGQPVAEAPVFKVGDYWELRQTVTQTNTPGDRETQWSRKIAEIGPDRIQVTWGDGKVWPYDAAMNFIARPSSEASVRSRCASNAAADPGKSSGCPSSRRSAAYAPMTITALRARSGAKS